MYDQIQAIVDNVPLRNHLFIVGDFNCKLDNLHLNYPDSIGKYTIGNANACGELLAKLCVRNNLIVTNTMFQKRKLHTWTFPDRKTRNQIDFILTRKTSVRQRVQDSTALSIPDIFDHRMVRTKIRMSLSWPKKQTSVPKCDLEALSTSYIEKRFHLELSNRFSSLREVVDPEALFEGIITAIKDAASTNLPAKRSPQPHWISEETKCAIDDKHKIGKVNGPSSLEYIIAKAEKACEERQTKTS